MHAKTNIKNLNRRRQIIYTPLTADNLCCQNILTEQYTHTEWASSNGTALLPYKIPVLNTTSCWLQLNGNQEELLLKISATIYFFNRAEDADASKLPFEPFHQGKKKNEQAEEVRRVFHPPSQGHLSLAPFFQWQQLVRAGNNSSSWEV